MATDLNDPFNIQEFKLLGLDNTSYVKVNTDGSINVNTVLPPSTPPSASVISQLVAQGKSFIVATSLNTASAGVDNPLVLIRNPIGSGKTLYLYRLIVGNLITNVQCDYRIHHTPTIISNGTAFTPTNALIGNSNTSVFNVYTLSTVSSTGTRLGSLNYGQNSNSLDYLGDFSIQLPPGKDFLLTGNPSSNNRISAITIVWVEF